MIPLDAAPRLRRAARLRYDRARDRWLLLAPERGFVLNASALTVVRGFGPGRSLAAVAESIALAAGDAAVAREVVAFVELLAARGLVEAAP